ncbi:MAG: hypothetical protein HUK05_05885, partial [Prevotella sp.]|nr:hypothetical protein [Prevotella sp.]
PKKFQIANSESLETIIEPHGYLIIWASKRDAIGSQIHGSFKLGNDDGQMLLLSSANGEWCDTLKYNAHRSDETVGRFPDGANDVYLMQRPTIKKTNVLTSYAQYQYTSNITPIEPDAIKNAYAKDIATVEDIEYYSVNGVLISSSKDNLANGVYIMKYRLNDGTIKSKKIIINKL